MIAEYNHKSLVFGAAGLILQFAGPIVAYFFFLAHIPRFLELRHDLFLTELMVLVLMLNCGGPLFAFPTLLILPWYQSLIMGTGTVLWLIGLAYYAKAKDRSPWLFLLYFLSLIGFLVLLRLEDRSVAQANECAKGTEKFAMCSIQRLVYGFSLVAALGTATPAWACPLCQSAASSAIDDGDDPYREANAYNHSIYVMLAVPYTIIGLAGFYCCRNFGRRPTAV